MDDDYDYGGGAWRGVVYGLIAEAGLGALVGVVVALWLMEAW